MLELPTRPWQWTTFKLTPNQIIQTLLLLHTEGEQFLFGNGDLINKYRWRNCLEKKLQKIWRLFVSVVLLPLPLY